MTDDLARSRALVLNALRFIGVALALVGAAIQAGKFPAVPRELGLVLLVVGAIDVILIPPLLARRWRSPRP